jgi:capsular polysaccharide transport system permease protein
VQPPHPPMPSAVSAPKGLKPRKFRTARNVFALMLREMSTTYGSSPGGYFWAIFDPAAALLIMSVVFSYALNVPPIGNSFPLFYATGYLPFMLFNDVANKMATAINFSRPLLAYPAVTFLDALIARFLLNVLTHLMVGYIVYSVLIFVIGARVDLDLPAALLGSAMAAMLGIGIGTLNCYLMSSFFIWERGWQLATRPLFIISGIFFMYGSMPEKAQDVLWYNPLVHVIGMTRSGFYANYDASYVSVTYIAVISAVTFTVGLLLLWRHHHSLLE